MTATDSTTTTTEPTTTEPVDTDALSRADDTEATASETEPDTGRDAAKDAAKYRRQARDAEAERDTLRAQLDTYQRGQVEAIAANAGVQKPAALWAAGSSLADCLGEGGQVDPQKAQAVVRQAVETLGLATGMAPTFEGGPRQSPRPQRGWSDLLSNR
ncbi:MAG: hypothetical protein ACR2M5_07390 [Nakamurella sp.]